MRTGVVCGGGTQKESNTFNPNFFSFYNTWAERLQRPMGTLAQPVLPGLGFWKTMDVGLTVS